MAIDFSRVAVSLALNDPAPNGAAPNGADETLLAYVASLHRRARGSFRVRLLHALPPADAAALGTGVGQSMAGAVERLEELRRRHFDAGAVVDWRVQSGAAIDIVLGAAAGWGADVLAVGHRTSARGRRSFSRRLAMKAPGSVLMVPEGSAPETQRIVVGIDLSIHSAHALGMATRIASSLGLPGVVALHAHTPGVLPLGDIERGELARTVERFMAPLELHGRRVDTVVIAESGAPATALVAAASQPGDLIVMGTRGHSPAAATLLGSESEHVLADAKGPVLVTKERGRRIGLLRALLDRDIHTEDELRFG